MTAPETSAHGTSAQAREPRFLTATVVAVFCALALFAVVFLAGEARRAKLLVEYEADRTAAALLEAYRSGEAIDSSAIDPRVLGFGVYLSGGALLRLGDAPDALPREQRAGFTYDRRARTLALARPLGTSGMGGAGSRAAPGQMMRRGGPGMRGMPMAGPRAGSVFLHMDARGYYRSRLLYTVGAVVAPFLVAGLGGLFLSMAAANRRYRRAAEDRELLARLGEAAHTLAHEIRNPLGAIRMQTGLLRKGASPSPAAHLDIIDEEVSRLTMLSRRVGDFLKNPRGNPERILLDSFLGELLPRFPRPVRLDAGPGCPEVFFDRDLLRSVVENLVRNAHESYDDEAAQEARDVTVAAAARPDGVRLSVFDRGKGVAADRAEQVFGPFVSDKAGGSGIGLSISRRFVEAAGGTLRLLPREGGGTEARVTLPLASAGGESA
jgi:two-component system, NtrC family, sensor histidine kinase HydH